MEFAEDALTDAFSVMLPHLDERQRRIVSGSLARALGRGGVAAVARAAGMSRSTVQTAANEVDAGIVPSVRVRRPGGGRKKAIDKDPNLLLELDDLVSPTSKGLTVQAERDEDYYPPGVKITDEQLAAVPLRPHEWHGERNYTVATSPTK